MKISNGPDFSFKDFSQAFSEDEYRAGEEVSGVGCGEEQVEDSEMGKSDNSTTFPDWVLLGVAGDYAKLYSAHVEPPIEFFYMSFLVCLGNVLADRLTAASEIYPQPRLYVLLLGE